MTKKQVLLIGLLSTIALFGCKKSPDTKKETITINFWDNEEKSNSTYIDSIIASFEKNNPNAKVVRTYYSVDDTYRQFQSASIAGSPPDVIFTTSDNTGLFIANSLIMPLNGQFDFSQYVDNAVDATIQDGKTWGVPNSYGNQLMLYYNTDYVKKAPQTTKDLIKLCDAIIKKKIKNNPSSSMTCLEIDQSEPFWLVPFLTSYGGWPINGHAPNLNTDNMVKALDFVKNFKKKGYMSPECDYNCMDQRFKEGNTAMIINGDWTSGVYVDSMKSKMKLALLPVNSDTGIRMRPMISGKYFFISSFIKPEHLVYVKKLVSMMNSAENQNKMIHEIKRLPALKSIFESVQIKRDPIFSVMARQIENGEAMPSVLEMRAAWDVMRQYQDLVLSDKMDSITAAKKMQEDVLKRIKEMK